LGIGRSRIVPEYSFLDKRGAGGLDGTRLGNAERSLRDGDAQDANWRPGPGAAAAALRARASQ